MIKRLTPYKALSAWDKTTLLADASWRYSFNAGEQADLIAVCQGAAFSDRLLHRFAFISDYLENSRGVFLLRNFPLPQDLAQTKHLMLLIGEHMGRALTQTLAGAKIMEIKAEGEKGRGALTNQYLQFHSDRSDVAVLLCCRKARQGGGNLLVSTPALHNHLLHTDPQSLACLYQPFYYQTVAWEGLDIPFYAVPVFNVHKGFFASRYLRALIDEAQNNPAVPRLSAKQQQALYALETAAADRRFCLELELEPGDMLFLNNFVTLHARSAFEDEPAANRLLLRLWLAMPNSRPLPPSFKPLFGKVAAGAYRGGVRVPNSLSPASPPIGGIK